MTAATTVGISTPTHGAAASAAPTDDAFRPPSLALATIGLSLGTFMQVLDLTIANVSLPTIAGELGVSQDESTWVITGFTIWQAIMLPMTGFLTRRFGEMRVFVVSAIAFALCSLSCGLATSLTMLVMFRAIQGAACGPMYPITQSLMVQIYPPDKRTVALSIISMITVVAPITGPVLGGWITYSYSWRWIFFINVPLGFIASALVFTQLRQRVEKLIREHIDWIGIAALVVGVGALQILLDKGNDDDWFSSTFIVTLGIVAAIGLTAWVVWELTEEHPAVDLRLFRHRNFAIGTLALVFCYALYFSIALLLPLWLQGTLGYTALWSGLAAAPVGIVPFCTVLLVGKYAHKFDLRLLASLAFFIIGLNCFRLGSFDTGVNFASVAMTEFIMGCGTAIFFLPVLTILLSELYGPAIAEGSGSATFFRTVGASFSVSITQYLWLRGQSVSHANLVEFINPFASGVRASITQAGGAVESYLSRVNGVISQQAAQVSFNHILDGLGIGFFILIALIWFAKPPFIPESRRVPAGPRPTTRGR